MIENKQKKKDTTAINVDKEKFHLEFDFLCKVIFFCQLC